MDIKTFATTLFITGIATCGSAHANDPSGSLNVSPRETKSLVTWQFSRDSLHWQTVRIPHDWAIAGPFDKKWDIQYVAIEQNGEKEKTEKKRSLRRLTLAGARLLLHTCHTFTMQRTARDA